MTLIALCDDRKAHTKGLVLLLSVACLVYLKRTKIGMLLDFKV